jgi:hypothetical protein
VNAIVVGDVGKVSSVVMPNFFQLLGAEGIMKDVAVNLKCGGSTGTTTGAVHCVCGLCVTGFGTRLAVPLKIRWRMIYEGPA